jgi:hypothetical protein
MLTRRPAVQAGEARTPALTSGGGALNLNVHFHALVPDGVFGR